MKVHAFSFVSFMVNFSFNRVSENLSDHKNNLIEGKLLCNHLPVSSPKTHRSVARGSVCRTWVDPDFPCNPL